MYDRILFPTDGSEEATAVLEHAVDLASAHDATLRVLHVADTNRDSVTTIGTDVLDVLEERGEEYVSAAVDRATERGVEAAGEVVQGDPHAAIVDYAASRDADLVVMATHGRRLRRYLLGSVTERVVRRSEVPVLTVRPDDRIAYPYGNVLVPTDGSDPATAAIEQASGVAAAAGAKLHLLSVVDTAGFGFDVRSDVAIDRFEEAAREAIETGTGTAERAGLADVTGAIEYGSIGREIVNYVEEHDVDLVAVGTRGHTGIDRYLLGSVTERLIRTSPVPVLTVRGPAE